MRIRTSPRRGIALIEMLAALMILAAVAILVGDLLVLLARNLTETRQRDTMITRVDSALDRLRRDAWRATAFRPRGDFVELDVPEGTVVWHAGPGGLSRVAAGEATRAWVEMPRMQFPADKTGQNGCLVVTVESGPAGAAKREDIELYSQRLLAGGVR